MLQGEEEIDVSVDEGAALVQRTADGARSCCGSTQWTLADDRVLNWPKWA